MYMLTRYSQNCQKYRTIGRDQIGLGKVESDHKAQLVTSFTNLFCLFLEIDSINFSAYHFLCIISFLNKFIGNLPYIGNRPYR